MPTLLELLNQKSESDDRLDGLLSRLKVEKEYYSPEDDRQWYNGDHPITRRETKRVEREDDQGNKTSTQVEMNKLVHNYPKKIVETAIAFLFGENATLTEGGEVDEELYESFRKVWTKVRMDYILEEAIRDCMIETKSAVLFYMTTGEPNNVFGEFNNTQDFNLRAKVLSYEKGDEIFPHFDSNGRMDAFTRVYKVPDYDRMDYSMDEPEQIERTEIYTDTEKHIIDKRQDGITRTIEKNPIGKIPVVYFDKKYPEWHDVRSLIDRLEWLNSKHSDSNDYFAFPALIVKGNVKNLPGKNEVGKLYEVEGRKKTDGSVDYSGGVDTLTWEQSPQSIKDEYEKLVENIYLLTHTPDISFNNLKGIGNVSGIALRLMFLDPIVKARNNKRLYGDKVNRAISLVKEFVTLVSKPSNREKYRSLSVAYHFDNIIPTSDADTIDNLTTSVGNKPILSQKTAVEQNPLVEDSEEEQKRIKDEESQQQQQAANNLMQGGSFNL